MHRETCPEVMSFASPASPAPALLETAVRLLTEAGPRRWMADIIVSNYAIRNRHGVSSNWVPLKSRAKNVAKG